MTQREIDENRCPFALSPVLHILDNAKHDQHCVRCGELITPGSGMTPGAMVVVQVLDPRPHWLTGKAPRLSKIVLMDWWYGGTYTTGEKSEPNVETPVPCGTLQ